MPEPDSLRFLLEMLDDDSPVVREALVRELGARGAELESEIARLDLKLSSEHWRRLAELRADARRTNLLARWPSCFAETEGRPLETAQSLLSEYIEARPRPGCLTQLLDELAAEFKAARPKRDACDLALFLFEEKALRGEHADYYAPLNSSLCHVIEQRRGNPISLCCVYMLTGARLGIAIEGLNLPGHFMTQTRIENETVIVDCFSGARFMSPSAFHEMAQRHGSPETFLNETVTAKDIVRRVLNNLIHSYTIVEDTGNIQLMRRLQKEMDRTGL